MKNNLIPIVLFGLMALVSCKDEPKGGYDPVTNTDTEYFPPEAEIDPEKTDSEEKGLKDQLILSGSGEKPDNSNSIRTPKLAEISGNYIKVGEENDNNCGCYCLDINFNSESELCLVKDDMYISSRFQRTGDNTINVFLIKPSTRNKQNEIPFQNFDTDSPIATIVQLPNGELELNWLGFKSNGDLINDYAIYGKKTLEGTYKRK